MAAESERECYEPLDPDYMLDMVEQFLAPLSRHYFRPRFIGLRVRPVPRSSGRKKVASPNGD